MTAKIMDGRALKAKVLEDLAKRIDPNSPPGLEVILVGDDPASRSYVRMKERAAKGLGIRGGVMRLPAETTQEQILREIARLNDDPLVHGILVQLPLPQHISPTLVQEAILPEKDVDCFHPYNLGRLFRGDPVFVPATPLGIMTLLKEHGVAVSGMNAVVVGRSDIVGKPTAALLSSKGADATVTVAHSRTKDLPGLLGGADLVVAAVGIPRFIKGEWLKDGAVVIDVGINSVNDPAAKKGYRLVGDVDLGSALEKASLITPVPGGVGPMTIAGLMKNVVLAKRLLDGDEVQADVHALQ